MFSKILIANRGEIACRIMETAHKMGVKTVAIYSDADASAKHVGMAHEAYRIGPPAVAESYLKIDLIIEIALESGAEAIHPGYGFLSENPEFVESVNAAGLRFIGPSAQAIRAMGLKDAAKTLMEKAGVPVVPGYHGDNQDSRFLAQQAEEIGYPVLIKARAGGGGKGMRKVEISDQFHAALESAQRESLSAFGDAHCLIEKWIISPRHIEIQVFGDDFGNVIHLFERDCSLQRRHQKVIEEAPAPGMTMQMREAMGAAAVQCAKSVNYSGAGTVEFIVDCSDGLHPDRFWFMEMNTRLQVEHPVTEMITGIDLVEWQLRIATGEALSQTQDSLILNGHAFEARIYAEDVPSGFLPVTGKLNYIALSNNARIDSGVRIGDDITPWYDPMIAKIIVHGATRDVALSKLRYAIAESHIAGTMTNLNFLSALCNHAEFTKGNVDTGLIENNLGNLIVQYKTNDITWALTAILASDLLNAASLSGWHTWSPLERSLLLSSGDNLQECVVSCIQAGKYRILIDSTIFLIEIAAIGINLMRWRHENQTSLLHYSIAGNEITLFREGRIERIDIVDNFSTIEENTSHNDTLVSPMPGVIKLVKAQAGSKVIKGEILLVVEAMKMEHTIVSVRDGIIADVFASLNQQVNAGEVLLTLEQQDA
ncbi:MAG: acetyl/propionyl/methylcrotonyl-CoA carboxylase subunit alpha [Paracoccaceae bacterium]